MGLDMYLARKHYVKNWEYMKDERWSVQVLHNGNHLPEAVLNPKNITYITEEVAYWRKANAIHAWFVRECQDGVDDCRNAYVSEEKLSELLDIVRAVLEDHSLAPKLLPAQAGFFFGPTEYDDWYFSNLEETVKLLEPLIEDVPADRPGFSEYEYHSSW